MLIGESRATIRAHPSVVADYSHGPPVTWRARISRDELSYDAKQPGHAAHREPAVTRCGVPPLLRGPRAKEAVCPLPQRRRGPVRPHRRARAHPGQRRRPAPGRQRGVPHRPRPMLQLLAELDSGQLALPDFQRTFVWAPDETRELLVSMIRSFPAGEPAVPAGR